MQAAQNLKSTALPFQQQGIVANLQFAGQETTNWTAVTGDTIWIGKMFFEDMAAPTAPGNLTASIDSSTVTLTWDASTDNQYVKGYVVSQDDIVLDTVTTITFEVTGLADGTYTFKVVAIDGSGNHHSPVQLRLSSPLHQPAFTSRVLKDLRFIQIRLHQLCR